jgi:hypothetical protein
VIKAPRTADGQFTVASDEGSKSAGIFTKDGILVSYLFHNLPLPKGNYSFWLPARNYVGQPIPAGEYEVRLAASDFKWTYLNHIADNGEDGSMEHSASRNPTFVAFAPNNVVVVQENPSEDHTGIRGYDAVTGKMRWYVFGASIAQGIAVGKDGMVYYLYSGDSSKGESRLTRVDAATGEVIPFPGSNYGHVYPILSRNVRSLTALGDRLYTADAESNKLFVITMADGKVEKTLEVAAPNHIAGDEKTKILWVVSGETLIAIAPDGSKVAESRAVPEPRTVAARDGQIAVASTKTGKVPPMIRSISSRCVKLAWATDLMGPFCPTGSSSRRRMADRTPIF